MVEVSACLDLSYLSSVNFLLHRYFISSLAHMVFSLPLQKLNKRLFVFTDKLREQLQDIVGLIRDPSLTSLSRITIKALIVIDVHAKDVIEDLVKKRVSNEKEFKWLSQMRYYLEDDEALVRLINATVKYAYEYLGMI